LHGTSIALIDRYRSKEAWNVPRIYKLAFNYKGGFMATPSSLDPLTFNATFDPAPDEGYQFTFHIPGTDISLNNAFFVAGEENTVEITLTNGTFAAVPNFPFIWSNPPNGETPAFNIINDGTTLVFVVPAPSHYFVPWVFRIIANAIVGDRLIPGVVSQNIYLVKEMSPAVVPPLTLTYSLETGVFTLLDMSNPSSPAELTLANTLLMINTIVPTSGDSPFTVTLGSPGIEFNSTPPVFIPSPSVGLTVAPLGDPIQAVQFKLTPEALGHGASLQFRINVPNPPNEPIVIVSPDPIIMNATIGDGST
jgi:hypothetical protein